MVPPITLSATTAEQQLFEICTRFVKVAAAYKAANPEADLKSLNVTQALDLNRARATFSIVLPLVQTDTADGGIEFDAESVMATPVL